MTKVTSQALQRTVEKTSCQTTAENSWRGAVGLQNVPDTSGRDRNSLVADSQ